MHNIAEKISAVRERIAQAAKQSGRKVEQIKLVAVSKRQSVAAIQTAYDAGQRVFGENYAQELRDKAAQLPSDIEWHMIGNVQRRNFKHLLPHCHCLQTLDSLELAAEIEKRCSTPLKCLIQINIGKEPSKSGISPENALSFLAALQTYSKVQVSGLMCIPPFHENPEASRPYFQQMRALLSSAKLSELSMGMSHDFDIAIEEGATIVRVGSAIFPARQ